MNELEQLKQKVAKLEGIINAIAFSDRYVFPKAIEITDGHNIKLGSANGTKIGTVASEKLGFFGSNPISQPTVFAPDYTNPTGLQVFAILESLGLVTTYT